MKISTTFGIALVAATSALLGCDDRSGSATPANQNTPANQRTPTNTNDRMPTATASLTTAPDNTGRNMADSPRDPTAMDQSNSSTAIAITAAVRRAIIEDKSMSMMAQNCKVITDENGVVTLRGPVQTQLEKDAIAAKAKSVANVTRVINELEVKAA